MYLEKAMLTATQNQKGALFCNAIDESPYDSTEWSNRMPADGYSFGADGELTYTHYFVCYDGWDSMSETDIFNTQQRAVDYAWRASFGTLDVCINPLQNQLTNKDLLPW